MSISSGPSERPPKPSQVSHGLWSVDGQPINPLCESQGTHPRTVLSQANGPQSVSKTTTLYTLTAVHLKSQLKSEYKLGTSPGDLPLKPIKLWCRLNELTSTIIHLGRSGWHSLASARHHHRHCHLPPVIVNSLGELCRLWTIQNNAVRTRTHRTRLTQLSFTPAALHRAHGRRIFSITDKLRRETTETV